MSTAWSTSPAEDSVISSGSKREFPQSNPIFNVLNNLGNVELLEAYQTFNMGMGFSMIVPADSAAEIVKKCPGSKIVGEIRDGYGVSVPSLDLKYEKY